jgi:hypothetical protein
MSARRRRTTTPPPAGLDGVEALPPASQCRDGVGAHVMRRGWVETSERRGCVRPRRASRDGPSSRPWRIDPHDRVLGLSGSTPRATRATDGDPEPAPRRRCPVARCRSETGRAPIGSRPERSVTWLPGTAVRVSGAQDSFTRSRLGGPRQRQVAGLDRTDSGEDVHTSFPPITRLGRRMTYSSAGRLPLMICDYPSRGDARTRATVSEGPSTTAGHARQRGRSSSRRRRGDTRPPLPSDRGHGAGGHWLPAFTGDPDGMRTPAPVPNGSASASLP